MKKGSSLRLMGIAMMALAISASVLLTDRAMLDAARDGDVETVRSLVQRGMDVNAAEGDGMTALHWAADGNHADVARVLVYAGARLESRTRIGAYTPLLVASRKGQAEVMEVLLDGGADVHVRTGTGAMTPLHFAAAAGNPRAIELLLQAGAEIDVREGGSEHTPLMIAAASGRTQAVRVLLDHGANIHLVNRKVDMAERQEEDNRARQLRNQRVTFLRDLERQANGANEEPEESTAAETPEEAGEEESAEEDAAEEETAEEVAVEEAPAEEASAPPAPALAGTFNITLDVGSQPVDAILTLALDGEELTGTLNGPTGTVELDVIGTGNEFEAHGTASEVGAFTVNGIVEGRQVSGSVDLAGMGTSAFTGSRAGASDEAVASEEEVAEGEEERPRSRFARAAQGSEEEEEEARPLSYAELVGGHGGFTALHLAVRQGHTEIVRMLLDAGAELNEPSLGDHSTPLLIASVNGHWDLLLELLEKGADPNIASDAGATPLYGVINLQWAPRAFYPQPRAHLVQQTEYLDVMRALLEAGADPNPRLNKHLWYKSFNFDVLNVHTEGATPFWRAAYATDVQAMKLLKEHGADPALSTVKPPERRRGYGGGDSEDQSGLPDLPVGAPSVSPLHAASGAGYGEGFAANAHRHVPGGWVPSARYLIEEVGLDVNARDHQGFTALHHAASRGDVDLIRYLVDQGADVTAVSRRGLTVADMANGPVQRTTPYPRAIELLLALGSPFNDNCVSC